MKLERVQPADPDYPARLAIRPATQADRRDARRQRAVIGGERAGDPPLTTRDCADWLGFTTEWVRGAINEGVQVQRQTVRLSAETVSINGRPVYRIHLDAFVRFLRAIGWQRLPKHPHKQ